MALCLSQFYVLSPRGDTILMRDFRGDVVKGTAEMFFRKVSLFSGEDCPPTFNSHGINYLFVKKNALYFVCTTQLNASAVGLLELLNKICKVFKDYCGTLTEESIRKNFVLLYELLEEMCDYGYPQMTNTEQLKLCVHNCAAPVLESGVSSLANLAATGGATAKGMLPNLGNVVLPSSAKTVPSNAVHRPVGPTQGAGGVAKNEIFVDILERVTVLMNSQGQLLNSCVDGSIQMKSYLSGNPELKLALNEDIAIGKDQIGRATVVLDDCNFHECVDLREFDDLRTLSFFPPDGEFAVMNYRITSEFRVPFRLLPRVEQTSKESVELSITARAELPEQNYGGNVQISINLPRGQVASINGTEVFGSVGGSSSNKDANAPESKQNSSVEFLANENRIAWVLKKFAGGSEVTLKTRLNFTTANSNWKGQLGPISMGFEIPMFSVSKIGVRYLRIAEQHKSYNPYRWVRYVTQSCSYVCRI
ncbi:unnamed protein product [Amoebophrya sp. A25]|nr:unnamed protein product [Amoebophrya sp. A25]|eukprot:GSA25T00003615001.1